MRSFRSDPYLWIHLAGAAAVPLLLELCLLGLANPGLPTGLELLWVGGIGVAPVLWMQWQRPFSIFSLVALALKPDHLTADQRRILRLFKTPLQRGLAVLTAIVLLVILWQIYQIAPIASEITLLNRVGRLGSLGIATIAFLAANLFLQVPVSVLRVLLTPSRRFAATEPYPLGQIARDFTLLGLRMNQILPPIAVETAAPATALAIPQTAAPAINRAVAPEETASEGVEAEGVDEDSEWDEFEDESGAVAAPIEEGEPQKEAIAAEVETILNQEDTDLSDQPTPEVSAELSQEIAPLVAQLEQETAEDAAKGLEVTVKLPEDAAEAVIRFSKGTLEASDEATVVLNLVSDSGETEVVVTAEETIVIDVEALEAKIANTSELDMLRMEPADENNTE